MKIILLIAIMLFSLEAKSLFSNNDQKDKSKYIGALKDLMIATQKTRGLTNSYLNGNTVALLLVFNNRKKMKVAIGEMETLPFAADPVINKRATTISQDLIKLNQKAFKRDSDEVFADYTEAIAQTLMLAQSVSKRDADKMNPLGQDLTAIMMQTMLPLIEYIGQLRGLGSGLAAKGTVTPSQLERLAGILNEVDTLSKEFEYSMNSIVRKYSDKFDPSINAKVDKVLKGAKEYMEFAKNNFLKPKFSVEANDYFDRGTAIITDIITVYDINNQIIKSDSEGWI